MFRVKKRRFREPLQLHWPARVKQRSGHVRLVLEEFVENGPCRSKVRVPTAVYALANLQRQGVTAHVVVKWLRPRQHVFSWGRISVIF